MKTITLFLFITISTVSLALDEKYLQAMQKNIEQVYKAQTAEELQKAVNSFDRIANVEKTKWEPLYYSAFGNVMLATREGDKAKKDQYLDLAWSAIEKAKTIQADNSELIAMEGFVHMIRVTVDPATRGQQYSSKAYEAYNRALAVDANNPRALALLAQMEFGTAQFFGSSTEGACTTANKAIEKFENFKSENPLAPMWGKEITLSLKKNCK